MVSWDHIFSSLHQYFSSLRQELANDSADQRFGGMTAPRNAQPRDITEQELDGLIAVCKLITKVADQVSGIYGIVRFNQLRMAKTTQRLV